MIKNIGKLVRSNVQTLSEAQAGYGAIGLVALMAILYFI